MTELVERQQPNNLLRRARLARLSPSGSGRPLSRQELAEAANAWVYAKTGIVVFRDGRYIGRLERGLRHWPQEHYRAALRALLGAATDADLGFYAPGRWSQTKADTRPHKPAHGCAGCPAVRAIRLHACGAGPAALIATVARAVAEAVAPVGVDIAGARMVVGLCACGCDVPALRDCGPGGVAGHGVTYRAVVVVPLPPHVPASVDHQQRHDPDATMSTMRPGQPDTDGTRR